MSLKRERKGQEAAAHAEQAAGLVLPTGGRGRGRKRPRPLRSPPLPAGVRGTRPETPARSPHPGVRPVSCCPSPSRGRAPPPPSHAAGKPLDHAPRWGRKRKGPGRPGRATSPCGVLRAPASQEWVCVLLCARERACSEAAAAAGDNTRAETGRGRRCGAAPSSGDADGAPRLSWGRAGPARAGAGLRGGGGAEGGAGRERRGPPPTRPAGGGPAPAPSAARAPG